MATLYYYKFKNYYYPSTKRFSDLSGYQPYLVFSESGNNLNFYENDGVNAEITAGRSGNPYYDKADYVIYSKDNTTITSRWYIIEAVKNASGQYNLQIHRDLPVDYYDEWTQSDCFIEKAILPDNSPFIYNQEEITTNQIKTDEIPLKDETKMAWIVGFIDREYKSDSPISINSTIVADYNYDDWKWKNYVDKEAYLVAIADGYVYVGDYTQETPYYKKIALNTYANAELGPQYSDYEYSDEGQRGLQAYIRDYGQELDHNITIYHNLYTGIKSDDNYNALQDQDGKIVLRNGIYYKVSAKIDTRTKTVTVDTDKAGEYLKSYLTKLFANYPGYIRGTPRFDIYIKYYALTLTLTTLTQGEYNITIPDKNHRMINKDGPFDLFCLPYADNMKFSYGGTEFTANKQFSLSLASEIARALGTKCYDVQILPYCPFGSYIWDNDVLTIATVTNRATYIYKGSESTEKAYCIFWSSSSSGTFNITDYRFNVTNKKMSNQVDMMRLVSPNFSSQFEFNPAKNEGISYFNVDYTYLPQSSYIHVNPDFKGLYKKDYDDARGLIFQGDFSIMYLSDAWVNYQTQNKNYLEIFNRQVESIETNYKYQRIQSGISSAVSALSAGLAVGGLINGGVGVLSGVASAAGGAADLYIQQQLHNEQLDYKNDMFGYQLDNIKALPHSIAKTTAYTRNNKIFPILEYYTCTDEEKEAVAKKIAFNGMSVGVINKPINYIGNSWSYGNIQDKGYIKCKLIKLEGAQANDFHLVNMLGEELNKGVYTK